MLPKDALLHHLAHLANSDQDTGCQHPDLLLFLATTTGYHIAATRTLEHYLYPLLSLPLAVGVRIVLLQLWSVDPVEIVDGGKKTFKSSATEGMVSLIAAINRTFATWPKTFPVPTVPLTRSCDGKKHQS